MSSMANGILIGFITGVLIVSAVAHSPSSKISIVREMIEECEKSLPRNEHCTIIALPISKD